MSEKSIKERVKTESKAKEGPSAKEAKESGFSAITQSRLFRIEPLLRVLLVLLIILSSFAVAALTLNVAAYFSGLILLFCASWLLALILTRPVSLLVRQGLPKMLAVALAYLLLVAGIAGFILLVLPGLIAQTQSLSNNLGNLTGELQKNANQILKGFGLSNVDLNQISAQLQSFGTDLLKNALGLATGIANFLVQFLLVLIISFSLLAGRNYEIVPSRSLAKQQKRTDSLWQQLPDRYRRRLEVIKLSFEKNFGAFLGGQLTVAVIYGLITWIVMWVAGFDYPVTTGCICGALMVIPFFGGPLSLLPPLIVAFSRNDSPIIIVLIVLFVIQTALLNVVLPKLVGESSGVSPVTTLFVLLAGAQIAGIFGVLMAVPVAGVVKSLSVGFLKEWLEKNDQETVATVSVAAPENTEIDLALKPLIGSHKTD
ncbi:MAG TPA: AI-2E family transporter [Chloroflexia bacterium]|nr:AI-2E family transporter [Chloroflexia bacterium]